MVRPVLGWRVPRYTADRKTLLRISVEVKLMVVMFSQVGQSGWCQEALPRPVLCHADQPGGKIGPHVRTGGRSWGREVKESVLNFWQTAGSRLTLFEEQTINSFM